MIGQFAIINFLQDERPLQGIGRNGEFEPAKRKGRELIPVQ
jgi:hypothetical protein